MSMLSVLGGGAAHGLFDAVAPEFERATGHAASGAFGPVGGMVDRLRAGEPTDLVILTADLIRALEGEGLVVAGSSRPVGRVATGVAVREGAPLPDVSTEDALSAVLLDADAVYVPDMEKSTAGRHMAGVFDRLGVREALGARLHALSSGSAAMKALAASGEPRALGCTQVTEILATPGLTLVGDLPAELGLATVYVGAVTARAAEPQLAARFLAMLGDPARGALRERLGFAATLG